MPRLNRLGDAVTGIAGATTGINGVVPPSLVGSEGAGWDWLNDTTILGQAGIPSLHSGAWRIYKTTAVAVAATDVANLQANATLAGGDVYQLWGSYGIATNVVAVPSLPNAGPGSVDRNGVWAVCTLRATGSGITVYSPTGTVLNQINEALKGTILMRGGFLTYDTNDGWPVVDVASGRPADGYIKQQNITGLIPVNANGDLVVVEYNAELAQWSIRNGDQTTGLIVNTAPVGGDPTLSFGMDAIYLNGKIRLAWCTAQDENAASLVRLDVDTTTRETTRAVGSGPFVAGPTLEGSRFQMIQAPVVYPPYKDQLSERGIMTQPWLRYLNNQAQAIAASTAAGKAVPPPSPPNQLSDAQVLVGAVSSSLPAGRLVTNTPTVTWDLSNPFAAKANVIAGGNGWIPLVDGSEPPNFITDGAGVLILVPGPR